MSYALFQVQMDKACRKVKCKRCGEKARRCRTKTGRVATFMHSARWHATRDKFFHPTPNGYVLNEGAELA